MNIKTSYELGQQFAKRIRIGKRFFGSMRMAERLYKDPTSMEYAVFMAGFHSVLNDYDIWISPETNLVTGFHFKGVK